MFLLPFLSPFLFGIRSSLIFLFSFRAFELTTKHPESWLICTFKCQLFQNFPIMQCRLIRCTVRSFSGCDQSCRRRGRRIIFTKSFFLFGGFTSGTCFYRYQRSTRFGCFISRTCFSSLSGCSRRWKRTKSDPSRLIPTTSTTRCTNSDRTGSPLSRRGSSSRRHRIRSLPPLKSRRSWRRNDGRLILFFSSLSSFSIVFSWLTSRGIRPFLSRWLLMLSSCLLFFVIAADVSGF
mmetsp:Transcript_9139/g.23150  ORF Transcript_9139/g.23150 Transcript_9139/m.23150 type:complete len:235 (-) Transcript_9139:392-1096(-)